MIFAVLHRVLAAEDSSETKKGDLNSPRVKGKSGSVCYWAVVELLPTASVSQASGLG